MLENSCIQTGTSPIMINNPSAMMVVFPETSGQRFSLSSPALTSTLHFCPSKERIELNHQHFAILVFFTLPGFAENCVFFFFNKKGKCKHGQMGVHGEEFLWVVRER